MAFPNLNKMKRSFPEPHHTKHQPDGSRPDYIKHSGMVESGHEEYDGRMDHPFGSDYPGDESGEGKSNDGRHGGKRGPL